ncbi:MAG TPA: SDR family oxidoreductase [Tepidisphaeraceae bacterium]|jgi:uncharacterized oxidoreductase|nr:SDR family oxidoreductase [Tepidisphaeraceae bacterium]
MTNTRNTIVITGGGSGIGKGLAESFQRLGNQVIIAGRRKDALDDVTASNPGMKSLALDVQSPASIKEFVARLTADFPSTNILINNSGIMRPENLKSLQDDPSIAEATVATNLLGPIRLTTAMLPLLKKQPRSTIMMVSSGLAFVPLSLTPTYCATKAAIHSYTQSLRFQLKDSVVEVLELIPPYVQTELMGEHQSSDPRAMPLDEYISEVMNILRTQPSVAEICVDRVKPLRFAAESGNYEGVFRGMNEAMPLPD